MYLDVFTRLSSHDCSNLEQRHHHAVNTLLFILFVLILSTRQLVYSSTHQLLNRLQSYTISDKVQTFSTFFYFGVIFLSHTFLAADCLFGADYTKNTENNFNLIVGALPRVRPSRRVLQIKNKNTPPQGRGSFPPPSRGRSGGDCLFHREVNKNTPPKGRGIFCESPIDSVSYCVIQPLPTGEGLGRGFEGLVGFLPPPSRRRNCNM